MMYQFNEIEKSLPQKQTLQSLMDLCYYSMVIESDWGEALLPVSISSESDLVRNFGEVTDTNFKEYYQAKIFLKYSTNFKPIRVVNQTSCNKRNDYIDNTVPTKTEIADFYNTDLADVSEIVTNRLCIIEKFINPNEDLSIAICSTDSSWDKEISYEKLNLVISKTETEPPTSPMNNDMYLLPTFSTGDWSGHDGEYAIWLHSNEAWNFVSVLANDTIYVRDENKEYNRISGSWIVQSDYYDQFEHIKYKNESAYRVVYEEPYQDSFGRVIKFNQMIVQKPDFSNDDFLILIFQKQKINNKFRLVERFITNYSTAETDINFTSKYIYIKVDSELNTNQIDTYNYSIVESRFEHDTNTNNAIIQADYELAITTMVSDDDIQIISDFEYDDEMTLVSGLLESLESNKILVSGCYDNTRYSSFTPVINDFGLFRTDTYYNTANYSNAFVIASEVLENDVRKYIPLYGDLIGLVMSNLANNILTNAGTKNGLLINTSKVLLRSNETNNTELHQNYINNIVWDDQLKSNYLSNDSMLNKSNINIGYTLLFNIVEKYINEFFVAYGLGCSRVKELEKLKNILEHKILGFGLDSTVTYAIDPDTGAISYTVTLIYKTNIKEIIVNFIIT